MAVATSAASPALGPVQSWEPGLCPPLSADVSPCSLWLLQGDMSDAVASALVLPLLRCAAAQPWPTVATVATLLATVLKHGTKQLAPTAAALWCGASAARTSKVRSRRAIADYCCGLLPSLVCQLW